jgi:predicted RNase H-like HicB family nuclease
MGGVKETAMHVTAVLSHAEEGGLLAFNPETGTTTQGETIDEALANLREAVEIYLEEFPMKLGAAPLVPTLDVAVHA